MWKIAELYSFMHTLANIGLGLAQLSKMFAETVVLTNYDLICISLLTLLIREKTNRQQSNEQKQLG